MRVSDYPRSPIPYSRPPSLSAIQELASDRREAAGRRAQEPLSVVRQVEQRTVRQRTAHARSLLPEFILQAQHECWLLQERQSLARRVIERSGKCLDATQAGAQSIAEIFR